MVESSSSENFKLPRVNGGITGSSLSGTHHNISLNGAQGKG